jgi:hypothetical protein
MAATASAIKPRNLDILTVFPPPNTAFAARFDELLETSVCLFFTAK